MRFRVAVQGGVRRGRKTVRSSVAVLAIYLIAAAAAAGAGDDIGWERSALIPCFALDTEVTASDHEFAAVLERYALSWDSARRNAAVGHIGAVFYGWEVHCARLRRDAAANGIPAAELRNKSERARGLFGELLIFFIAVAARYAPDTNLNDPTRWSVYLLYNGEFRNPSFLGEPDAAFRDIKVVPISLRTVPGTLGGTAPKTRVPHGYPETSENPPYRKVLKVAFDNPWEGTPRGSVKLVVAGKKACRGFEWRFEEE